MLTSQHRYWLAALCNDQAFADEQQRLRSHWTFVCFASELARPNDWVRADLYGRSIFIQNFDGELRGFVNSCAHRQFPIRNADRGNGPVRCPFHHWVYDKTGRAAGIPMSKDLFGGSPKTIKAQLERVDVDTCGSLVFARLPADGENQSLADWLGPAAPIVSYFTAGATPVFSCEVPRWQTSSTLLPPYGRPRVTRSLGTNDFIETRSQKKDR